MISMKDGCDLCHGLRRALIFIEILYFKFNFNLLSISFQHRLLLRENLKLVSIQRCITEMYGSTKLYYNSQNKLRKLCDKISNKKKLKIKFTRNQAPMLLKFVFKKKNVQNSESIRANETTKKMNGCPVWTVTTKL